MQLFQSMKMLAGLISRCSTLPPLPRSSGTLLWQQSRASSSWQQIFQMTSSSIQFIICLDFFNSVPRSPRAQYSIMMQTFEFALSTTRSTQRTMLGCSNSFRRFTSVTNCCFSRLLIFQKLIYFHTRVSPPCFGFTFRTMPKEPLPIYQRGMYLSIILNQQLLNQGYIRKAGGEEKLIMEINERLQESTKFKYHFVVLKATPSPPSINHPIFISLIKAALDLIIYNNVVHRQSPLLSPQNLHLPRLPSRPHHQSPAVPAIKKRGGGVQPQEEVAAACLLVHRIFDCREAVRQL